MEVKKYVTMIFLFKKVRFWKIGMFKIKSFVVDQIVFYTDMGDGGGGLEIFKLFQVAFWFQPFKKSKSQVAVSFR